VAGVVGIGMFVIMALLNASLEGKQTDAAKKATGAAKKEVSTSPDTAAPLPAGTAAVSVQYCGA
jgi:hypothetical protein